MSRCNQDIRTAARTAGVYLWQVANKLGMHDSALARKMRYELPDKEKQAVLCVIKELEQEGGGKDGDDKRDCR